MAVSIEPERIHDLGAALQGDRVAFLACATVAEEMRPLLPPSVDCQILGFGCHSNPDSLDWERKDAVHDLASRLHATVLAYGLCAMAVGGLKSDTCNLLRVAGLGAGGTQDRGTASVIETVGHDSARLARHLGASSCRRLRSRTKPVTVWV